MQPNGRERRGVMRTVLLLVVVALAIYVVFLASGMKG